MSVNAVEAHFNNETMRKYNEFISNVDEVVKNADDVLVPC